MKLYLMRHGDALAEKIDPHKPLSPEGRGQTEKMARFLKEKNIAIDILWHSSKLRAIETGRIISDAIPFQRIEQREDLNPQDPVEALESEMVVLNKDLLIVGHLPFLPRLVSWLLSGSTEPLAIRFGNSGLLCLEFTGTWQVAWMVVPELL